MIRHRHWLCVSALLLAFACAGISTSRAVGQAINGLRNDDPHAGVKARLLGVLCTPLTLNFENVPARDAFNAIARTLNLNVIGRYSDDSAGHGLDPNLPVTIAVDGRAAREVLEELLEQCEIFEDCTWQLRNGFIELGTKRRLSSRAAREARTYTMTDLLLEPPYFENPHTERTRYEKLDSPYVESLLGEASRRSVREGSPVRKTKVDLLLELAEGLVEIVEPGHWDLGGNDEADATEPESDVVHAAAKSRAVRQARDERLWASMRAYREALIITAPDFIHRQIAGYPAPTLPENMQPVTVPSPPSCATQ